MIIDKIENWKKYFINKSWEKCFDFLLSLKEKEIEDGKYSIEDKLIFARVMSYSTKSRNDAVLEAHNEYVDIQSSIINAEGMEWYPRHELRIKEKYNKEKDVEHFYKPEYSLARFDINPGTFVVFFPEDAHLPQLCVNDNIKNIKKVVIKLHISKLL